jgi:phospholipid-translocating P-type ATPase (flippase)
VFLQADGHCQVRNFNVHEDLAKVEYIFSDKTGTLTRNMMRLSQWGVWHANKINLLDEQADPGCLRRLLSDVSPFHNSLPLTDIIESQLHGISLDRAPLLELTAKESLPMKCDDIKSFADMQTSSTHFDSGSPGIDFGIAAGLFGRLVALCHGVLPSNFEEDGQSWEGQSPDEVALVEAVSANGIQLVKRTKRRMTLEIKGRLEEYTLLHMLDFSSERKRMSVIIRVRNTIGHRYFVLSKGADSVMLPLLTGNGGSILQASVDTLARRGLRVLVLAAREINIDIYEAFREALDSAENDLYQRKTRLAAACSLLEKDLLPVGVVAIEDKLQCHVPSTLAFLLSAGIRIWLLTGDKRETAVNIGMSSQLIRPSMLMCTLEAAETPSSYFQAICVLVRALYGSCPSFTTEIASAADLKHAAEDVSRFIATAEHPASVALILDGQLIDATLQRDCPLFIQLARTCSSVIVCRASPLQKARVVSLVRSQTSSVTLAIGDGANDVAMIEAAHIGVGIVGREGGQASRAADYAIAEFRFLKRLLVVHGRYAYLRLSKLILVSIYKNAMLALTMFWFGIASAWSAQTLYSALFLFLYNIIYTSLAPMVIALFEKVSIETFLNFFLIPFFDLFKMLLNMDHASLIF